MTTTPSPSLVVNAGALYELVSNATDHLHHQVTVDPSRSVLYYLDRYANTFILPLIIAVGIVGNTLSFCVFRFTALRSFPSNVYLSALAVADIGFLFALFLSWLGVLHVPVVHWPVVCRLNVYVGYVFGFLSVWYVVSFTVERYIVVCYPLHRFRAYTYGRARTVVIGLATLALVSYAFVLATLSSRRQPDGSYICYSDPKYHAVLTVFSHVDTAITLPIPFAIILFMNSRIVYALYCARSLSSLEPSPASCGTHIPLGSDPMHRSIILRNTSQAKVTKTLVLVSSAFLLLNLPSHLIRLYLLVAQDRNTQVSDELQYSQRLAQLVYYVNFSINFFLYSMCGHNFRNNLRNIVCSPVRPTRSGVARSGTMITRASSSFTTHPRGGGGANNAGGGSQTKSVTSRCKNVNYSSVIIEEAI